ncbi:ESPR-type extended signal peptide-containing protein [Stenotrophomonas sp. ZAC14A_NAIMI4_1]|uniref:ESPR-type extended signal peptide-containing protein n=1 Tax=Stenotrophomonas sp. ZAC14A_NAIMI4_1 TaxID=2072412 RepID=UPI000D53D356|nr:ESPR-type extended signal peptide-containing protein [Stenotrophomonas sp. ZAC14A_NAIMI4_1]AWH45095.1 autotransporter [Stenotrophomonas sp. ZAC14A_NAIMI4_1]
MNRIYRRIWNATRRCWVVASELSSPRGKPARTRVLMSAFLLAAASTASAANHADDTEASKEEPKRLEVQKERIVLMSASPLNAMASAIAPRGLNYQMAIVTSGNYADAVVSGQDTLALGSRARISGTESTAVGNYAVTSGGYATAFGHDAQATGSHSTAVGRSSRATVKGAVALGQNAQARSENAIAIGSGSYADDTNSVAIGANSLSSGSNTVSVGRSGGERRITNVREGSNGTDAVNVNQLANTNRNVATAQATANTAKSNADSALSKANTLSTLLSQTASNGNVRIGASNSGSLLDIRNSSGYARKITGVAEGTIGSSSTDAVNGTQLNRVQNSASDARNLASSAQASANTAQTTADSAKTNADSALGKANTLSTLLSQTASNGNVRIGGGNSGTTLDVRNSGNSNRQITGVAKGKVDSTSTDAVNGQQLNDTHGVASSAAASAKAAMSKAEATASQLSSATLAIGQSANASATYGTAVGGNASAGDYAVAVGNEAQAKEMYSTALGRSANAGSRAATALGNSSAAGGSGSTAIGYIAKSAGTNAVSLGYDAKGTGAYSSALGASASATHSRSVALGSGSETTGIDQVSVGNATVQRKIVNMADGLVESGSMEAVTGNQLFETHNTAVSAKTAADAALGQVKASTYLTAHGVVGNDTNKAQATGAGALASGIYTEAKGSSALAMGNSAKALANNAIALGAGASARHAGSIALGSGSQTTAEDQVSVGSASKGRKIVNVAKGDVSDTSSEAVTGAQLFATDEMARGAETLAQGAAKAADNAVAKVTVLEGLVREDGPSGSVRLGGNNSGSVLDVRNKSDGKRKITGVAEGALVAGSTDAVTGGQLAATNASVAGAETLIADIAARVEAASRHVAVGTPIDDEKAQAGRLGIAMGDSAVAAPTKDGAVALGSYSRALGENSVALGRASWVHDSATDGFALGVRAVVEERGGLALGAGSAVRKTALNAVAIGEGSVATESRTASFGDGALQRRLTNLARGTADHNATTVGQLNDTLATLGGGAKMDATGNVTAPTYTVQNTRQHTVGDALTVLDGAVVRASSRMDRVEGQLRSVFQDTPAARADGLNQLTLAGANGMILSNVGNGLIAAGSRDAVNGGQLHSMQQQLNGRMDGLEQRIDGQPQSRLMALASDDAGTPASTPVVEEPTSSASNDDKLAANTGNTPKSSPQPKAEAPESPKPQVDTAELEKMLARANDYSDGIAREVDARLNKMDKRFNRMAAMSSAQTAMAMNTAGLATYNRLGAGVGYAEGESAMAVGYQRVLNEKGSATFSLNGAFTNSGERSMGVGVGIGW